MATKIKTTKKLATSWTDDELKAALRTVPQRIVGQMCGMRQTVHLQRVATRWSFPIDGKTVDLFAVMNRLWSFLTQYGPMLSAVMEDVGEDDGDDNALGVRYLRAKTRKTEAEADAAQLRVEERKGTLCQRDFIHDFLSRLANRIRSAGEQAQRNWGEDGFELFHQIELATREDMARLAKKESESEAVAADSTRDKSSGRSRRGILKAKRPRRTTAK